MEATVAIHTLQEAGIFAESNWNDGAVYGGNIHQHMVAVRVATEDLGRAIEIIAEEV